MKKPAVFLDRDGVVTKEKSYVKSVTEVEIFDYAKESIHRIHEKGYYVFIVTNQSGVARGLFSMDDLLQMNELVRRETDVDAIYYCPHYPEGIIKEYSKYCTCRKPAIGMFQMACKEFDIDMEHSYMVGDRASDILAGQNAGLQTVLLESGYGTKRLEGNVNPDLILENLEAFSVWLGEEREK